ncbi:MAG: spore gernimation protein GerPD [Paenibacillus sp.]|nr:spore gernimation protein GerPD [Paenibacillus sp.]
MEYNVINGELMVTTIKMTYVSTSSIIMVGDIKTIALLSVFEGPPEQVIVGVTLPVLPPIIPTTE